MRRRQHSRSVESLIEAFAERLFEAVERTIEARAQVLSTEWLDVALPPPVATGRMMLRPPRATSGAPVPAQGVAAETSADGTAPQVMNRAMPGAFATPKRGRTRAATSGTNRGAAPASAALSPEQQLRDAEFARLRALLKPTQPDDASEVRVPLPARAAPLVVDAPADPLRVLEGEIRNQAQELAQLPSTSCTARIAAWAGRVRSYEETSGNRVAADLLLDKLRVLARAMDAGRIEALNGSWKTSDWATYIRMNQALAEAPREAVATRAAPAAEPSGEPDYGDIWSQPS